MDNSRVAGMLLLVSLLAPQALAAQSTEDSAQAVHLMNRATWGGGSAEVAEILTAGRTAWLERQLHPGGIADAALAERLKRLSTLSLSMAELYRDYSPQRPAAAARMADSTGMAPTPLSAAERRQRQETSPQRVIAELVTARVQRAVYTERQLEDVMTDFWFNHFNVVFSKGQDRYLVGDYERNAIRAHVFGRFSDMLLATAEHPAMLFYLDNWTSVYVDTAGGARRGVRRMPAQPARSRGLNENYARELLELHTLGVDAGYTQADIVDVARAFTGWSFTPPNVRGMQSGRAAGGDVGFVFRAQLHDRGVKRVLGEVLPAGRGLEDGRDVIRMLASHPATARHIAHKLVERFVSDEPVPALEEHLAAVFMRTGGDLREVTRALFTSDLFYAPEVRRVKVKTPLELVVSAFRVTGADVGASRTTMELLRSMGQLPYGEAAPTGYPAASDEWVNTGAMLSRMNFGLDLAAGRLDGVRIESRLLRSATGTDVGKPPLDMLLEHILPGVETERLGEQIRTDIAGRELAPRERAQRTLGLILGSPDFQRR